MTSHADAPPLLTGLLRSTARFADRPAVEVDGDTVSYEELYERARSIAATLRANDATADVSLTALLASRTHTAYAGVVGILLRGHGYVPLNPKFPAERNRAMLTRAGCGAVVVDRGAVRGVPELVAGIRQPLVLVLPDGDSAAAVEDDVRPHRVVVADDAPHVPTAADARAPAYLLFTSGSTGEPKGVLVRQSNVRPFLDAIAARYDFDERDRFSQSFDLTFDLSVFDLFAAWEHGACVCCPSERMLLKPTTFIRDSRVTVWFSVPSLAMFAHRLRALKPGVLPSLRWSLFCGEGLPADLARAWAAAARNSVVENLYGPTEATIACTAHRWDSERDVAGLVPIGRPFGQTRTRVVDERLGDVPAGEAGELVLAGPQVVEGYWRDERVTARAFFSMEDGSRWYRTGDRVVAEPSSGRLSYLGRLDNQIKVLGHRVELEEVETVVREEAAAEAVAVGWPLTASGAAGIIAFVADPRLDERSVRSRIARRLPDYMVPREIRPVDEFPLNANGKRDRKALIRILEDN